MEKDKGKTSIEPDSEVSGKEEMWEIVQDLGIPEIKWLLNLDIPELKRLLKYDGELKDTYRALHEDQKDYITDIIRRCDNEIQRRVSEVREKVNSIIIKYLEEDGTDEEVIVATKYFYGKKIPERKKVKIMIDSISLNEEIRKTIESHLKDLDYDFDSSNEIDIIISWGGIRSHEEALFKRRRYREVLCDGGYIIGMIPPIGIMLKKEKAGDMKIVGLNNSYLSEIIDFSGFEKELISLMEYNGDNYLFKAKEKNPMIHLYNF